MNEAIPFVSTEGCIHSRFDEIAALLPDNIAVSDNENSLTYDGLRIASNRMAHSILGKLGPGRGNIALFIENNIYQIIAILGIMKSGRSYVALDVSHHPERNKQIFEDAGCEMLICTKSTETSIKKIFQATHHDCADMIPSSIPDSSPQTNVLPSENAITLYTSGSTGKPKGVLQSHRNMVHFIKRMSELYPILPSDKVAYFLSVGFSAHALPLLGALLNGSELKCHNVKEGNFNHFSNWFAASEISFAMMIPSFLRHFTSSLDPGNGFPHLRLLMLGGETLYRSDVEKARKVFDRNLLIVNIYASTEAYLMRSFPIKHNTIIKTNTVPIGYPVEGMEIMLVDKNGKEVNEKYSGEIILKSKYLTEGYHNRPELQESDFIQDPKNPGMRILRTYDLAYYSHQNCMIHIGRGDQVVKLRGYRIDFGEIINLLLDNNSVTEAFCTLQKNPQGDDHIIAYLVPADKKTPDIEHLNTMLVRMLPDYMIPSHILLINSLPKNSSGKIMASELPEPEWYSGSGIIKEMAENDIERTLTEIFEATLKISPIGTNENFLKLGANSLSLFVALSEVEKKFTVKIDIKVAMDTPNIKSLASFVEQAQIK